MTRHQSNSSFSTVFLFFVFALILLYFVFSPVVLLPHGQIDDYYYFIDDAVTFENLPQRAFNDLIGRSMYNLIHYVLAVNIVSDICSLGVMRLVGIIFLSISAAILAFWLSKIYFDAKTAFVIGVSIILLPSSNFFIFLAAGAPLAAATVFALIAAMLIEKVDPKIFFSRKLFIKDNFKHLFFTLLALCTFIAGLYTYQAWSMFFLVPTFCLILFSDFGEWAHTRLRAIRNIAVYSIGCSIYFTVHYFLILPMYLARHPEMEKAYFGDTAHRFDLVSDLQTKASLIKRIFFKVSNLWNTAPSESVAYFVLILIFIGVLISLVQTLFGERDSDKRAVSMRRKAESFTIAIALLVAVNAPILLSSGGHDAYRANFAFSALILLAVVWALNSIVSFMIERRRPVIVLIIASVILVSSGFTVQRNAIRNAVNTNLELSFLKTKIMNNLDGLKRIHVIRFPPKPSHFIKIVADDEIDVFSSRYWFAVPWMVRLILMQIDIDESRSKVFPVINEKGKWDNVPQDRMLVSTSFPNEPIFAPKDALIINMNELQIDYFCTDYSLPGCRKKTSRASRATPHLIKSIGKINIVEYNGAYYGVPQNLGEVKWHDEDVSTMPGVVTAKSLEDVEVQLK